MPLTPRSPINHDPARRVRVNYTVLTDRQGRYRRLERVADESLADGLRRQRDAGARRDARDLRASMAFAWLIFAAILAGSVVMYVWG